MEIGGIHCRRDPICVLSSHDGHRRPHRAWLDAKLGFAFWPEERNAAAANATAVVRETATPMKATQDDR